MAWRSQVTLTLWGFFSYKSELLVFLGPTQECLGLGVATTRSLEEQPGLQRQVEPVGRGGDS